MIDTREECPPLRFALMLDSSNLAQWQSVCLRQLLSSGHAELQAVLAKRSVASAQGGRTLTQKVLRNPRLLWNAYNGRFVEPRVPALRPVPLAQVTDQMPIFVEPVKQGRFGEMIPDEVITHLRSLDLDFILRLGFGILKGDILHCARHGVWSFHHGDPEWVRGVPPGFWEVYEEQPATGVILQRLSEKLDAGVVLHRGFFPTVTHSYPATLQRILTASTHFPARVCAELRATGSLPEVETSKLGAIRYAPTNRQMSRFFATQSSRRVANIRRYRTQRQQWNVAYVPAPIEVCAGLLGMEAQNAAFAQARWMERRPHCFRADPFMVQADADNAGPLIAFEHYDWKTQRGTIATARLGEGHRSFSPASDVLSLPTHLSYPFPLRVNGEGYVVPENSEGGVVRAYRFDISNGHLDAAFTILDDTRLIDATIVEHGGHHYLFGILEEDSPNTKLFIYHAAEVTGPWVPHPLNPVYCDVTGARPAGAFFSHSGELYRPAQDCAEEYGRRIVINRVDELSRTAFRETRVATCEPHAAWSCNEGMHTISACGAGTLIDAYCLEPAWKA